MSFQIRVVRFAKCYVMTWIVLTCPRVAHTINTGFKCVGSMITHIRLFFVHKKQCTTKVSFFFFLVCVYGANVIVQSSLSIQLYSLVKSLKMLKILSTSWKKYSALRLYYVTIPSVVNVNINNLKQLDIHKLIMINTIILTMICPTKKRGGGGEEIKKIPPSSLEKHFYCLLWTEQWRKLWAAIFVAM